MLHSLLLLLLASLLTAGAAQTLPNYYCNPETSIIQAKNFIIYTRPEGQPGYQPEMICNFIVDSDALLFVEILSFDVASAELTISSDNQVLFKGSRIASYQTSFSTPTSSLQIRFSSLSDYWRRAGVVIRVRQFDYYPCPPDWTYSEGSCYGTSSTSGQLSFSDAQKACNSMRSNLLEVPSAHYYAINSWMRRLPTNLRRTYTWIGLTDKTSRGRFAYYWLSGLRQPTASEISCVSTGNYNRCFQWERCGTFSDKSYYNSIYMADCSVAQDYACSMPTSGTGEFYTIPDSPDTNLVAPTPSIGVSPAVIWGSSVAGFLFVGFIVSASASYLRAKRSRRAAAAAAAAATGVQVSVGRVSTLSAVGRYPVQFSRTTAVNSPGMRYTPQLPLAPPSYSEAISDGYSNPVFAH